MKKILYLFPLLLLFTSSCSIKPEPIQYGEDNCIACQMTIMDRRYGTEIVTNKGKVYKFDSVECLVEFYQENNGGEEEFNLVLFTPFDQPGKLVNAYESHVLHCENLPSPMGMFLTAFETEATALSFKEQYGGKMYCWNGLMENYKVIRWSGGQVVK
ncbi:MAG: nitrous oxide reductase accessory protein NosL [Bacteroidales bacterium]|nr:nitrous oxide reductase accessory protein NosL [Bacteroidales bacterium]